MKPEIPQVEDEYHLVSSGYDIHRAMPWKDPPCYEKFGKPSINRLGPWLDKWRTVSHDKRVSEISMESWISVVCHLNNDDFHGELPAIF